MVGGKSNVFSIVFKYDITYRKCTVIHPSVLKLRLFLEISTVSFSCFFSFLKTIYNSLYSAHVVNISQFCVSSSLYVIK